MARRLCDSVVLTRSAIHCLSDRSQRPSTAAARLVRLGRRRSGSRHLRSGRTSSPRPLRSMRKRPSPSGSRISPARRTGGDRLGRGSGGGLRARRPKLLVDPGPDARQVLLFSFWNSCGRLAEHPGEVARELGDEVADEQPQDRHDVDVDQDDRQPARERPPHHPQPRHAVHQRCQQIGHQDGEDEGERDVPEDVDDEDAEEREAPQLREAPEATPNTRRPRGSEAAAWSSRSPFQAELRTDGRGAGRSDGSATRHPRPAAAPATSLAPLVLARSAGHGGQLLAHDVAQGRGGRASRVKPCASATSSARAAPRKRQANLPLGRRRR